MKIRSFLLMAICCFMLLPATTKAGTYYFSGDCSDCSDAQGILVTNFDPAPGGVFIASDLVSFTYSSSLHSFTWTLSQPGASLSGTMPASFPGTMEVSISGLDGAPSGTVGHFDSHADGTWTLTFKDIIEDFGPSHVWSLAPVPEPGTFGLILSGLGASLVFKLRRRH